MNISYDVAAFPAPVGHKFFAPQPKCLPVGISQGPDGSLKKLRPVLEVMADCRLLVFLLEAGDLRMSFFIGYSAFLFFKVHLIPLARLLRSG